MRETRIIMGMPVAIDIVGTDDPGVHQIAFAYFEAVDRRFSTYRHDSEISAINRGETEPGQYSAEMAEVFAIAETTRWETLGYFNIRTPQGTLDPSGIVKGWAIRNAARLLESTGATNFFVDVGGDIQVLGVNSDGNNWRIGLRDPFHPDQIVKLVYPRGSGIATSGNYVRGDHIYDPHAPDHPITDLVSLTVIGPDVLEADRFATAAFAMGADGISFIEKTPGLEGYAIDVVGIATFTSGFGAYTQP